MTENVDHSVSQGFVDIVKMGAAPGKEHLWRALFKKKPCGSLSWQ